MTDELADAIRRTALGQRVDTSYLKKRPKAPDLPSDPWVEGIKAQIKGERRKREQP